MIYIYVEEKEIYYQNKWYLVYSRFHDNVNQSSEGIELREKKQ